MGRNSWRGVAAVGLALWLAACGGGDDADPQGTGPVTIGVDGGSVVAAGVKIVIPPGAMAGETTVRVAKDSTGAPTLPQWVQPAGDMLAITPHGSVFSEPVTVRLPVPGVTLQANQKLFIAKAQPGGEWEVLGETVHKDGLLEVQVQSFSFFVPVVVTYLPPVGPLATFTPFAISSLTLECDGAPCANPELVRSMIVTATVTNNGGQLPANCVDPKIVLRDGTRSMNNLGDPIDATPATVARVDSSPHFGPFKDVYVDKFVNVVASLRCTDAVSNVFSYQSSRNARFNVSIGRKVPSTPSVLRFPAALTQAVGDTPTLQAVMVGGASYSKDSSGTFYAPPTAADQAVVYLERLAAADSAWRTVATFGQTAANPQPFGAGSPAWMYWGFEHALGPLTLADNGALYRMRGCYRAATATQATCEAGPTARLTVVQQIVAPAYTQQPRSVLTTPGTTASFSVVTGGTPAPTLQWQTRPANSTGDWTDVTSGSGATTPNYTTPVVSLADNGVQYRVLATNSAPGSTASQAVTVSVAATVEAPSIVSQPAALTVVAGSEAVFAVAARGTEALSYQWHKGGQPVAGANSAQLKISNAAPGDAGSYSVNVSNAVGNVFSDSVSLGVTAMPTAAAVAPSIVTQPAAVAVTEGNVATFAVGVSGSGPLAFQWRKNGVDIAGATAAAYTLPAVASADAGTYSVQVVNGAGSVLSQSATLAVAIAVTPTVPVPPALPSIVTQPASIVVAPGMSAAIGVGVQGSGPLSYQWLRNGAVVPGQTAAIYAIASASALDAGLYQVRVSNSAGPVFSSPSQVILLGAPAITTAPAAAAATEGNVASFGVVASGDAPRYQWTRNNVAIAGADAASYTTPALTLADSGAVYGVIVYNGAGIVFSQGAVLSVNPGNVVQTVTLASVSSTGVRGDNTSQSEDLSADGRLLAFTSTATNLVPGTNPTTENGNAYLRNLTTGVTSLINQTLSGTPSSRGVGELKLAAGGRFAVFTSLANDLVAGDTNGSMDIFLRDLQTGTTTRLNVLPDGSEMPSVGNAISNFSLSISADGRWVSFSAQSDMLTDGRPLPTGVIYLRDTQNNTTRLVASNPNVNYTLAAISGSGSHIAYLYGTSPPRNVINVYDVQLGGTMELLSVDTSNFPDGLGSSLSLSDNGRYLAVSLRSAALVGGAGGAYNQAVVLDRLNPGAISIASTGQNGVGDGHSSYPKLSGDGRYVLFSTNSPGLTGDPAATVRPYLMLRDMAGLTTTVASRRTNGTNVWVAGNAWGKHALSANGSVLAMVADQFDVTGEGGGGAQIFVAPRP